MCAIVSTPALPDRRNPESRVRLLDRIRGEFREMPCLRLTCPQARRLFAMRADVCDRVLATLVAEGMLVRGDDGRYAVPRGAAWPAVQGGWPGDRAAATKAS
jgi:hypothetical protein